MSAVAMRNLTLLLCRCPSKQHQSSTKVHLRPPLRTGLQGQRRQNDPLGLPPGSAEDRGVCGSCILLPVPLPAPATAEAAVPAGYPLAFGMLSPAVIYGARCTNGKGFPSAQHRLYGTRTHAGSKSDDAHGICCPESPLHRANHPPAACADRDDEGEAAETSPVPGAHSQQEKHALWPSTATSALVS